MASAFGIKTDYSAKELRRLAAASKNANQSRRLLCLAGVRDGTNRTEAARIGGMAGQQQDCQTLWDRVQRFNQSGRTIPQDEAIGLPLTTIRAVLAISAATLIIFG